MVSSQRIARQVGATVRRLRSQRGQAQRQVARLAGIPRAALYRPCDDCEAINKEEAKKYKR